MKTTRPTPTTAIFIIGRQQQQHDKGEALLLTLTRIQLVLRRRCPTRSTPFLRRGITISNTTTIIILVVVLLLVVLAVVFLVGVFLRSHHRHQSLQTPLMPRSRWQREEVISAAVAASIIVFGGGARAIKGPRPQAFARPRRLTNTNTIIKNTTINILSLLITRRLQSLC